MASKRMLQVSEQIREHVALMLARGEISDPRVKNVTIQSCKVTADLQTARLYFSVLGDLAQRKVVEKTLKSAAGFIRHSLGEKLQLRYTPHVVFFYDDTVERISHMTALLTKVAQERAQNSSQEDEQAETHVSTPPGKSPQERGLEL